MCLNVGCSPLVPGKLNLHFNCMIQMKLRSRVSLDANSQCIVSEITILEYCSRSSSSVYEGVVEMNFKVEAKICVYNSLWNRWS